MLLNTRQVATSKKAKILILQNVIFEYRKPVYNELSKYYDTTVLQSGEVSVGKNDVYREIIVPMRRLGPFFLQRGVIKQVGSGRYDAVIAMFDLYWVNNIFGLIFRGRVPYIWWGHRYSGNRLANKLRDLLMKPSDAIILYSNTDKNMIAHRGIPLSKIFVAQNTIHVSNHEDGSSHRKDSFLFVGRTQKSKNVDVLIRAFSEVVNELGKKVTVNIVGSGPEDNYLRKLAQELKLGDRVLFQGTIVEDERLKPYFHRAYAYVSPGPVGLGAIHSLAYGVPVVTNLDGKHGPEFEDLRNHQNALLYRTYDELKDILVSLCNDKTLSARLGRNAYELYSKERMLGTMVQGFRDAIQHVLSYKDVGRPLFL